MRILIVDDDIDDQLIIRWAIREIIPKHECTIANNGEEAMEYIETAVPYDIVLLDLNMPVMNGFDTLKTIKQIDGYKEVPVIIMSTSRSHYDIERSKRLGASKYIQKPGTFSELVDELKQLLQ